MKERLLLVTRNFPPLTGGMERLNFHVYQELSKGYHVSVAGPVGCQQYLSEHTAFKTFPAKPLFLFLFQSLIATFRLAIQERPNLILAGSGSAAIAALLAGKIAGAKVMVYLHGLDIIYPNPIYQLCFLPAIRRCDGILVNSSHTKNLAVQKIINVDKVTILNPGVTLPDPSILSADSNLFKQKYGIAQNKRILLSVGRLTERKGLPEFIRFSMPDIIAEYPDCMLVIIGTEPNFAVSKQTGTIARIKQTAQQCHLEDCILLLGQVSDEDLANAYVSSDILIFPVLDLPGDVEGFGMVAVEAAAHGLPTAAFAVGGVTDAIDHNKSGWLVNSGDYETLINTIIGHLNFNSRLQGIEDKAILKINCQQHAAKFSWDMFGKKLIFTCQKTLYTS
jgi:phosphatidylinositol alpha-1,6-mannosyltransferase